jgi:hypothetical protein
MCDKNISLRPNPFEGLKRLGCRGAATAMSRRWPGKGEKTMKWTLIRYKAKPEAAEKNAELISAVFAELETAKPDGTRYLALRLEDDSFVHFVGTDASDGISALPKLKAFQAFQSGIRERCVEPPAPRGASIVGNYRMLDE